MYGVLGDSIQFNEFRGHETLVKKKKSYFTID